MTITDFMTEFSKVQDAFRWECLENGAVRGVSKSEKIRATFDPVTAILFSRNEQEPVEADRIRAAEQLGLSAIDSAAIRDAADGVLWARVDGETVLDGYADWIRGEVALAIGLELDDARTPPPEIEAARIPPAGIPLEPETQLQHF